MSMTKDTNKALAIILIVAGAGIAYWGYTLSGSFDSQLNQAFTGSASNGVMLRYIGGAALIAGGLFLLFKK